MGKWWLAVGLILVLGGHAWAEEQSERERDWGFGWDSGLTLRRNFEKWQVGVSAGPNDYLRDNFVDAFDSDYPDTLQGLPYRKERDRRESGFVRLHLAREITAYQTLKLQGLVSGIYSWEDSRWLDTYHYYDAGQGPYYRENISEEWGEHWDLLLGVRVSWFPVPFLSLEHEFGLRYQWTQTESTDYAFDSREGEYREEVRTGRYQSFESFGPYSLTSDIQLVIWF